MFDTSGNLYVAEFQGHRVRKIFANGTITTYAGTGSSLGYFTGNNGPATSAVVKAPTGLAIDTIGNLFIAQPQNYVVRKVFTNGTITFYAGYGAAGGACCDGGPATSAKINKPYDLAMNSVGDLYIRTFDNKVRKVFANGTITTFAGTGVAAPAPFNGDGIAATSANLYGPYGVLADTIGNVYLSDERHQRIRKVFPNGTITTFAGNGVAFFLGDGGPATSAELNDPHGLASDTSGNIYIADYTNNRIRKVFTNGTITTFAGNGKNAYAGDGGPAVNGSIHFPYGIAVATSGNIFLSDQDNNRIRYVTQ